MGEPQGVLIIPIGFNPSDELRSVTVDANDYLHTVLTTGLTGGGMGEPVGPIATVAGYNPSGELRTIELDADDNLLITLLGGAANQILASDGTKFEAADLATLIVSEWFKGANVYNSGNISIPHNTWTLLTFDTELWDTDTIHSTVSNTSRLTCKTAGKYRIIGYFTFAPSAGGARRGGLIYYNGTTIVGYDEKFGGNAALYPSLLPTTELELAVDDYVDLYAFQDSGGALVVGANASYSPYFMMERVG